VIAALAELKTRRGDRDGAEALFSGLLHRTPDDPILLTARGIARIETDPAAARSDLIRAVELQPGNPRAHFGLGLLLRRESPREAAAQADAALAADPSMLDAVQLRAVCLARLGDLAAIDDAERLGRVQTPHRLYNAACALALLVRTAGEARLAPRALALLDRALDAGISPAQAAADPDFEALRDRPEFRRLLEKPRNAAATPRP
jgi:hypothetical protein